MLDIKLQPFHINMLKNKFKLLKLSKNYALEVLIMIKVGQLNM